ncbi:MAG: asparagine synthase (glutamine-hydrolyzing) [Betaproteobacteria bacterium]|nr:asparagine synthase (glutamine-hydrolyzing) [Betaproteobacteria bacterium]
MCGISGFVDYGGQVHDRGGLIRRMNRMLTHRGPDAEGYFESAPAFLGHRRLSVIDLASSLQPMTSTDGRHTLVFNGEIYNFRALRAELESQGCRFHTRGDTEVVLQALAHWGEGALDRLQGMFAFACWDAEEQVLFAARDHFGVKPFYYFHAGPSFAFGSELKSIAVHPAVSNEIDLDALGTYLECQYIPGPQSIYRDVRKLEPGHCLRLTRAGLSIRRFWQLDYRRKVQRTEAEHVAALDQALRQSVEGMLVADVPLGAFVSGGIDSSLVAAIMTDVGGKPVETFNLGFANDRTQSEHEHAERVARHIGARHHALMVTPDDVLAAFDGWVDVFDEPFGDQAALPTLLLSRLTRRHVTVALTGEGADEVFSGYPNYRKRVSEERITRVLGHRASPVRWLVPRLSASLAKDRILRAAALPLAERYATIPMLFDRLLHPNLLSRPMLDAQRTSIKDCARRFFDQCNAADYHERIMDVDLHLWLPDDLLTKVDRASMAHSLEARVPYLDHRFVEFAATLPIGLKQKGRATKYILKKVAERYLPADIIYRNKQGFVMPLSDWLQGGLRPAMDAALAPAALPARGLFRPGALDKVVHEHRSGRRNHAGRIWALTVLERWFARHAPAFRL